MAGRTGGRVDGLAAVAEAGTFASPPRSFILIKNLVASAKRQFTIGMHKCNAQNLKSRGVKCSK